MTIVPLSVTSVAEYFFAGSMHVGGGSAKVVTRGAEPSAGGHWVGVPGGMLDPGVVTAVVVDAIGVPSGLVPGGIEPRSVGRVVVGSVVAVALTSWSRL